MSSSTAPPTPPDFSKLARRPSERAAIVEYIRATPALQETDYLEWKTIYDLKNKKSGRASASKHLIAFANRDFAQAARHADGHAYLVLGVEPGNLVGVPVWDSADIENWLSPYTGTELRYGPPDYVTVAGTHVLFLVVDPPRQGDPIYCLQKASSDPSGDAMPEAAIYVRRGGKSDVATAADIARLTARANATTATTLDVAVELDAKDVAVIDASWLADSTRDAYVEKERKRLMRTLPKPRTSPFDVGPMNLGEDRTQDEFVEEVRDYLRDVEERWFDIVAVQHVAAEESELTPVLVNNIASNFEDVVLELTFPLGADHIYATRSSARWRLEPPEPPKEWASLKHVLAGPTVDLSESLPWNAQLPEVEELDGDRSLVRYPGVHVRPFSRHPLSRLLFALRAELAGQTLEVRWRITSRSTHGELPGTTELVVPSVAR